MTITENKFVSLIYELRKDDELGEIIESVNEDNALSFVFGKGQMLESFESNIKDLSKESPFSFGIEAANAYGIYYDNALADVPKEVFLQDGKIDENVVFINNFIPMQDDKGNVFQGKVLAIEDAFVKMDFNHPLAGVNLHFTGKIIEVREATHQELNPDNHGHSCGCGC